MAIIRATITLADASTRFKDFNDADSANEWLSVVGQNATYGDPATYTTSVVDVTQLEADKALLEKGLKAQEIGNKAVALVYAVNTSKNITADQLLAIMGDQQLSMAERLLRSGSLATAKAMLQAMPTTYFTAEEIARVVALIDSSGLV